METGDRRADAARPLDPCRLIDALPDVVLAIDGEARLVHVNAAAERRGWDRAGWIGRSALDLIHPDDLGLAMASVESMHDKSVGTPIEIRIAHPTQGWRLFEVIGENHLDDDLGVIVLVCRDLSDRRKWEVAAGDVPRFQAVVQHSSAITMLVDGRGRIQSASAALTRLTGVDPEKIVGMPLSRLADDGHDVALEQLLDLRAGRQTASVEVPVRRGFGGPTAQVRFDVVDLRDDPVVAGFVVTGLDVTELHSTRDELRRLATHDALTGLPNRLSLNDGIRDALIRRGYGEQVGLLLVDLDRFKPVNDLLGHDAGDELLVAVATRLVGLVRAGDTVARIGGDEFVVLAPALGDRAAIEALGRRVEAAVAQPFALRGGVATVSASIGVACSDETSTVASLMAEADQAMYQIKSTRRTGTLPLVRGWTERRELAALLRGAVDRGEMRAHLQPVVSVDDGTVVGFEALVRWHRPDGRVLGPGEFLDVAFETGIGTEIDRLITDQACSMLRRVHEQLPDAWVSVNMSAHDLVDPRIVAVVGDAIGRHGLSPQHLVIEVTEQATLEQLGVRDQASPQATLRELARLGVRIALDDFGTGYSSLTHLRKLEVHTIKIDRSFVAGVARDDRDRSLVSAMIELAHRLGLRAVAEGVERADQLDVLRELGCDAAQGYLVSPAIAPDRLIGWVAGQLADSVAGGDAVVVETRG